MRSFWEAEPPPMAQSTHGPRRAQAALGTRPPRALETLLSKTMQPQIRTRNRVLCSAGLALPAGRRAALPRAEQRRETHKAWRLCALGRAPLPPRRLHRAPPARPNRHHNVSSFCWAGVATRNLSEWCLVVSAGLFCGLPWPREWFLVVPCGHVSVFWWFVPPRSGF